MPSSQFLAVRLNAAYGDIKEFSFVYDSSDSSSERLFGAYREPLLALGGVLLDCGADCTIVSSASEPQTNDDGNLLLPVLHKYWGEKASFRKLKFYLHPDVDNKMEEISQGAISEFVVRQAEKALADNADYSDVLLTAPTGAGKSLLFQLPALYLAATYNAVTLVIEPLKALMKDQVDGLKKEGCHIGCGYQF